MPEPVSAIVASSAPAAVSAGASALALAVLGVDVQALALGLVGAVLGMTFAPPASLWHAAARFVASAIFAAVMGSTVAEAMGWTVMRKGCAICVTGIVLHLGLSWLSRRFDRLADAGAARLGVNVEGKQ